LPFDNGRNGKKSLDKNNEDGKFPDESNEVNRPVLARKAAEVRAV